jgi:hypothetical protein
MSNISSESKIVRDSKEVGSQKQDSEKTNESNLLENETIRRPGEDQQAMILRLHNSGMSMDNILEAIPGAGGGGGPTGR